MGVVKITFVCFLAASSVQAQSAKKPNGLDDQPKMKAVGDP